MPGVFDEDPFAPPRKSTKQVIVGENVDDFSVGDLSERIDVLRGEIARLEAFIKAREATRAAAAGAFKT